jgi:hypothetical protein
MSPRPPLLRVNPVSRISIYFNRQSSAVHRSTRRW